MENLIESVEKLEVTDGDVVILHSNFMHGNGDDSLSRRLLQTMAEHIREKYGNVLFVLLYNDQSFQSISEKEMNEMGWFRENKSSHMLPFFI